MSKKTNDYKSFQYLESGDVLFSQYSTIKSNSELDPGFYSLSHTTSYTDERVLLKTISNLERLEDFNYPNENVIIDLLKQFCSDDVKKKIKSLGIIHKLGLLYYGPQGTGKTSIIKKYSQQLIDTDKALVFFMDCEDYLLGKTWKFIEDIRNIQDNLIIIIFDEFDKFTNSKSEVEIKTITDGNRSIDNCIFFATTNHLDKIPKEIYDRPSRFKHVINIEGFNSQEQVKKLISILIGDICSSEEIESISNNMKGKSIDVIKQACLDRIMNMNQFSFKTERKKLGFFN